MRHLLISHEKLISCGFVVSLCAKLRNGVRLYQALLASSAGGNDILWLATFAEAFAVSWQSRPDDEALEFLTTA